MTEPLRLAMWSGPRNVSTALMRAFDSRVESLVCDEPLYAHYLKVTGLDHPVADQIVATHENDWRKVVDWLTGPLPEGRTLFYQKHMAHHLIPEIERGWLQQLTNAFLIRDPRQMLTSLLEILPEPRIEDTGYPQQVELFEAERTRTGRLPIVVDSKDLLEDPRGMLAALCERVGVSFDEGMLSWEPGLRDTDGCWAAEWYGNALSSTGFQPYRPKEVRVPARFASLESECVALYERLHPHRLTVR
ncbi:MAG: HAD family hydrolase [Planctomycetota bacterium]|nr:HAD family hydrolase [Planctomycetota bacterium]